MSNAEDRQMDTAAGPAGLTEQTEPAPMERTRPAWLMITAIVAVALVAMVVIVMLIPNGGVTP